MPGIDAGGLDALIKQLKRNLPDAQEEFRRAGAWLGDRYIKILKEHTPVDTGLLRDSWEYEVVTVFDGLRINVWNTAESKSGEHYLEFVDQGHRLKINGKVIKWVEGQFFIDQATQELERNLGNFYQNTSNRVKAALLKGIV